jgi:hypothetical protein
MRAQRFFSTKRDFNPQKRQSSPKGALSLGEANFGLSSEERREIMQMIAKFTCKVKGSGRRK